MASTSEYDGSKVRTEVFGHSSKTRQTSLVMWIMSFADSTFGARCVWVDVSLVPVTRVSDTRMGRVPPGTRDEEKGSEMSSLSVWDVREGKVHEWV
jgi:hypothetical protein